MNEKFDYLRAQNPRFNRSIAEAHATLDATCPNLRLYSNGGGVGDSMIPSRADYPATDSTDRDGTLHAVDSTKTLESLGVTDDEPIYLECRFDGDDGYLNSVGIMLWGK